MFIEAAGGQNDRTHGIPNLELVVANDPAFFTKGSLPLVARKAYARLETVEAHPQHCRRRNGTDRRQRCADGARRYGACVLNTGALKLATYTR